MKWFLLLLMAGAAGAIFYYRDEIRESFDKSTTTGGDKQPPEEVVATGDGSAPPSTAGTTAPGSGSTATPGGPGRTQEGSPGAPATGGPKDDAIAERYPLPAITLDEAVGGWDKIPRSAFGRQVTVKKEVQIVIPGVGSSSAPAGEKLYAIAADGPKLTVARSRETSARGQIHIDDTDFKQVISAVFDRWKQAKTAMVMKQRARARKLLAENPTIVSSPSTPVAARDRNVAHLLQYEKELGPLPKRNADGTIQIMVNSIRNGDTSEIKLEIIENWGPIVREEVEGKYYWTATVDYKTVSMFGELNTEAMALMRNGRVENWIYTGSGEEVP